jgi:hypothetical protein
MYEKIYPLPAIPDIQKEMFIAVHEELYDEALRIYNETLEKAF